MQLYNTLSRQVEEFVPLHPETRQVGVYSCGITAYDYAHIGNLRRYVMDDILVRVLRRLGYEVKHVQNVTDVGHLTSDADEGEDKIEKNARRFGKNPWEIARYFEDYFVEASSEVGNIPPNILSRATEHIAEQIAIVQDLERLGYTYIIPGDGVYFDTSKDEDYGKLARLDLANLKEGARVDKVDGKRNPSDFALWKFEKTGENRAMVWPSPWGQRTFPGWHTECVAMSMKYLGQQYDIHTGGIDHIPVHHTNEIAQAECATGRVPYVKYWVHSNFLRVDGRKMSKSLQNCYLLNDLKARGFKPLALRYLYLTAHYRSELNFTWDSMTAAQKAYDSLVTQVWQLKSGPTRDDYYEVLDDRINTLRDRFYTPLFDDLRTAEALPIFSQVVKASIPNRDKYDLIIEFDDVLGLGLREAADQYGAKQGQKIEISLTPTLEKLLQERETAKTERDFAKADYLRTQIQAQGYRLVDEPNGTQRLEALS